VTPRTRRLLALGAAVVLLLLAGRAVVGLLADRWWAGTISAAAQDAVTRWTLYGWLLNAFAVLVATAWFAANAMVVVRGIASVTMARRVGMQEVPVAVPPHLLTRWALGVGLLLGAITGGGAESWRAPFAIARQGVRFGVVEPVSGADLGHFVARLPAAQIAHEFVFTLVLLGIALVTVLYLVSGGIRRDGGQLVVHPHSRRHLGALFALLALVIAVGSLLHPWSTIAGLAEPLALVDSRFSVIASQALFGAGLAVAGLSLAWAQTGRHSLLLAAWMVLGVAALGERFLLPVLTMPTAPVEGADAQIQQATARVWGIRLDTALAGPDTIPSVTGRWDRTALGRALDVQGRTLLGATPARASVGDSIRPVWHLLVADVRADPRHEWLTVPDGTAPLRDDPETRERFGMADARVLPGAAAWTQAPSGVPVGGVVRRLLLTWARQAAGVLRLSPDSHVDWHLEPNARPAAIMPMVSWLPADAAVIDGRPTWLVQGVIPVEEFPLATRTTWGTRQVAGVMPAFVAVVDPITGAMRIYPDPGADSLATAWAALMGPVVEPATSLPPSVRDALTYPRLLFEAQLRVLEGPAWQLGRRAGRRVPDGPPELPVPIWSREDGAGWQAVLEDPTRLTIASLLAAHRRAGRLHVALQRHDGQGPENGREVERAWNRLPTLVQWRDSSRAAGDSVITGTVRWHLGAGGLVAWQPILAISRTGRANALAVAVSVGDRVAVARAPAEAWQQLLGPGRDGPVPEVSEDLSGQWAKAREWLARADSALARGDMTAFGRAYEALRRLVQEQTPE
jgi:hypothetical protein